MDEFLVFLFAREQIIFTVILIALTTVLVGGIIVEKSMKHETLSVSQAVDLMDDKKLVILDIRAERERSGGQILRAQHMPLDKSKASLNDLDKKSPTLFYCRNGQRSAQMANALAKNGFENVFSLKGGFDAWVRAGLPVAENEKA